VIQALPAFRTDRLQRRWSGGDLLVQVCSDDPPAGTTTRNLFGQRDGSMNPSRPQDVAEVVWAREGPAGYSLDDGPSTDGTPEAGLLFAVFQADAATAFVPVQRRLAETEALNTSATHVGSAAFALPPGCARGSSWGSGSSVPDSHRACTGVPSTGFEPATYRLGGGCSIP
jgi:deferrochelatase/peroxidase EfeB